MLSEFRNVGTCRFLDANCSPRPGSVGAATPRVTVDRSDCSTSRDLSGPAVASAPYTLATAELAKGRTLRVTYDREMVGTDEIPRETVAYTVTKVVAGADDRASSTLSSKGHRPRSTDGCASLSSRVGAVRMAR